MATDLRGPQTARPAPNVNGLVFAWYPDDVVAAGGDIALVRVALPAYHRTGLVVLWCSLRYGHNVLSSARLAMVLNARRRLPGLSL